MSVDTLTDSELRTKLAEYGYPVGPVTQTTRKILAKKLKTLMESRGGGGSRHSLAARYSSDETDEDTTSNSSRKKKPSASARRQTMANPMPPPTGFALAPAAPPAAAPSVPRSPGKRKAPAARNSEPKEIQALEEYNEVPTSSSNRSITRTIQKKVTRTYKSTSASDGLETGSDSDITEEPEKSYYASKSYDSRPRERSSAEIDQSASTKLYESRAKAPAITPKVDKYVVPPFKPNISPILPVRDEPAAYKKDDLSVNDILSNYETPYLSEFTRRLSSRSSIHLPAPSRSTMKSPVVRSSVLENKESDTNGHFGDLRTRSYTTAGSSSSTSYGSSNNRARDAVSRTFKSSANGKEEVRSHHNMVSMVLVIVLALFFGVLAVMYLGLGGKTETFPSLPTDSNFMLCTSSDHDKPGVNCLLKEKLVNVKNLLAEIMPILKEKAVAASCDGTEEAAYLTDSEIINKFTSDKVSETEVKSDLRSAQLLIFNNPKWGISLMEIGATDPLDSMDKVFHTRLATNLGMIIKNPELPMNCFIKQKLFAVFTTLLALVIGAAVIFGGQRLVLWYLKYKKSTEREIFQLVSEIISKVEVHHQNACTTSPGGTQESYLAINHVRDNLIPPKDRKKMAGLWEKAVKFLDENESRIRREVQQVSGEEFHVWRWLPNNILNTSTNPQIPTTSKKAKVWQGQAFDTKEGSVNTLNCSPTPCLKIRHMFDPDVEFEENWETKVQDAILEKCGEGVKILHIRVDRGSREGCVYMRCMSQEDAGKAYRALHGCWFDGNLVTVKYLRLERYHERFPDATRCTSPLKPSNNQRLSMQGHSWQTSLEAN